MTINGDQISVILPVYNGATFIYQAIDSILAQSIQPMEIIVIDDGSTDDTASVVKRFGDQVHYYYQNNSGTSVSRNRGVQLARGDLLAFLDADDLWPSDKLEKQVAALRDDPALDLIWGNVIEFRGPGTPDSTAGRPVPGHHPGTMLIRRQAFSRIGEFSTTYQQVEVVEWMTRVLQAQINQHMLPDVLMYRRLHAANKGMSNPAAGRQYLQVLKKHLERTRTK